MQETVGYGRLYSGRDWAPLHCAVIEADGILDLAQEFTDAQVQVLLNDSKVLVRAVSCVVLSFFLLYSYVTLLNQCVLLLSCAS